MTTSHKRRRSQNKQRRQPPKSAPSSNAPAPQTAAPALQTSTSEDQNTLPVKLYHYTTLGGLQGILGTLPEKACFWATHALFMNDSQEFRQGLEEIQNAAKNLAETPEIKKNKIKKQVLDYFIRILNAKNFDVYVISFATEPDSLSQWRAYAHEKGFCLDFDFNALKEHAQKMGWMTIKCHYPKPEDKKTNQNNRIFQNEILKILEETIDNPTEEQKEKIRQQAEQYIENGLTEISIGRTQPIQISDAPKAGQELIKADAEAGAKQAIALTKLSAYLLKNASAIKHFGFHEEAEWRLVMYNRAEIEGDKSPEWQETKFRQSLFGLTPYVEFNLGEQNAGNDPQATRCNIENLLTGITIGPTPHPELAEKALRMFLESKQLSKIEIKTSTIPYRNW